MQEIFWLLSCIPITPLCFFIALFTAKSACKNINSKNIFVNGTIEGDIEADKKATLGKGSHLEGNLQASIITIEEGAKFDGMCHMIQENKTDKKIQSIHDANFNAKNETA